VFLVAWTVLVILFVGWLVSGANAGDATWVIGDEAARNSLTDRIALWFRLVNLNFHGMYPWILLAPYVLWLGLHFTLERSRWRTAFPAHLAGCILFTVASRELAAHGGWNRRVIIAYRTEQRASLNGGGKSPESIVRTNLFSFISDGTLPSLAALPPDITKSPPEIVQSVKIRGNGASPVFGGPDGMSKETSIFWTQAVEKGFSDLLNVLAYGSLAGIAQAVYFYRHSRERERRAAALEAQLTEARLSTLQAQLHPHFLFNALNAISTLLRRDTRAAQDALAAFSDLLRMALSQSTQQEVPLGEDLRFLRRYVEIQTTRLGDRLRYEEFVPENTLDCFVPALLLQPLVENAIRHGIEPSPNPGTVRVVVEPNGQRLLLTVEDTGVGFPTGSHSETNEGIGIGLDNLRARLRSLYGANQRLAIAPRAEGGVAVHVEIPLRRGVSSELASNAGENNPAAQ
jgi:hypothetical protein